jgi:hypothetical protein
VFSDVWGPAPTSVGWFNYYVSFIDDYSKFTWIYLLRHKSKVFNVLAISKTLLNANLIAKFVSCKHIGVGSIEL